VGKYENSLASLFYILPFFSIIPFPLDDHNLARFAAFLSFSFKTADAISCYISGVRSVYRFAYLRDPPGTGPELFLTLRGFRRLAQHRVRPVDALLPHDLLLLSKVVNFHCPRGKAFWASTLVGFYTFFRNSTLMPRKKSSCVTPHLLRGDVVVKDGALHVSLRFSKTRQFNDTLLVFPIPSIPGSRFCAVQAWLDHMMASPAPISAPAFTWKGGNLYYYTIFSSDLQRYVSLAGIKKLIRPTL
jgi:hypothetical protein